MNKFNLILAGLVVLVAIQLARANETKDTNDELELENELDDDHNEQLDGMNYEQKLQDPGKVQAHTGSLALSAYGTIDPLIGENLNIFKKNTHNCNKNWITENRCKQCCLLHKKAYVYKVASCTCQETTTELPVASAAKLRAARMEEERQKAANDA